MEEAEDIQQTPQSQQLQQMLDLERSIKTYFASLTAKQLELKQNREMVKDAYSNDETYISHEEKVKEAKMIAEKTKDQIEKVPSVVEAKKNIREIQEDVKEMQKALSGFLLQYHKVSGVTHIMVRDGEEYQIIEQAKLVKKKGE